MPAQLDTDDRIIAKLCTCTNELIYYTITVITIDIGINSLSFFELSWEGKFSLHRYIIST